MSRKILNAIKNLGALKGKSPRVFASASNFRLI